MAINHATDKLIVVRYPGMCGGKFLINCLGLSDDAVFQHSWYAEQQLLGKFTPADKIEYLLREVAEVNEIHKEWSDLFLGCFQLFGMFTEHQALDANWDPVLAKVIDSGKYFFIVAHDTESYDGIKSIWTDARSIQFINCDVFVPEVRPNNCPEEYDIVDDVAEHTWDAQWFLNEDATVQHVSEVYKKFNLTDFNESYIRDYHRCWLETIKVS